MRSLKATCPQHLSAICTAGTSVLQKRCCWRFGMWVERSRGTNSWRKCLRIPTKSLPTPDSWEVLRFQWVPPWPCTEVSEKHDQVQYLLASGVRSKLPNSCYTVTQAFTPRTPVSVKTMRLQHFANLFPPIWWLCWHTFSWAKAKQMCHMCR